MNVKKIISGTIDEETIEEKIAIVRHHLNDLKLSLQDNPYAVDELKDELEVYLDGLVDDIDEFIADINEIENEDYDE